MESESKCDGNFVRNFKTLKLKINAELWRDKLICLTCASYSWFGGSGNYGLAGSFINILASYCLPRMLGTSSGYNTYQIRLGQPTAEWKLQVVFRVVNGKLMTSSLRRNTWKQSVYWLGWWFCQVLNEFSKINGHLFFSQGPRR